MVDRSKQGFSAPDASWFRGESIDYINRLLRDPRAQIYDFVNPAYVSRVLDQFKIEAPFAKRWDGHMHTAAKIATVGGTTAKTAT